jgi:hypothetical protein
MKRPLTRPTEGLALEALADRDLACCLHHAPAPCLIYLPLHAPCPLAQVAPYATSLVDHFNTQRRVGTYLSEPSSGLGGVDGAVKLASRGKLPGGGIGPSDVDDMHDPTSGVWWPDSLAPAMAWSGAGAAADSGWGGLPALFNPFAPVDGRALAQHLTEQLGAGEGAGALQPFMACGGASEADVAAERGNLAIARQGAPPQLGHGTAQNIICRRPQ